MADPAGFEKFYEEQRGAVDYQVGRMGMRPEDADDMKQEVWLKLWRTYGKYDPARCTPRVWAWLNIREVWRDKRNTMAFRPLPTAGLLSVDPGGAIPLGDVPAGTSEAIVAMARAGEQEARAWVRERLSIVRRATTDDEYKILVNLWVDGRTEQEVAALMGLSRRVVETVKERCLQRLITAGAVEGRGIFGLGSN